MNRFFSRALIFSAFTFLIFDIVSVFLFFCTEDAGYYHESFNFTWWMLLTSLVWNTFFAGLAWYLHLPLEKLADEEEKADNTYSQPKEEPKQDSDDNNFFPHSPYL